jgi:hypothetical protein
MIIDYNRGVSIRVDPSSGAKVYMYKDSPGVFLNAHGAEVADSLARRCGFDVTTLKREREKREAIGEAMADIEAQFESEKSRKVEKVVKEKEGYRVVDFGFGRHSVFGPEGEKLHDKYLNKQEALHLLKVIVKTPTPTPEAASEPTTPTEPEKEK